jgi:electron transfer flavoprotein alpha subunit
MMDSSNTTTRYGDIWVYVEHSNGKPARVSLELLGAGRTLAQKIGVSVSAIVVGDTVSGLAGELIFWGADTVIAADDPVARDYRTEVYTRIIVDQALRWRPEIFLVGATPIGRDLAPRIAARLNTGCTADCTDLRIDEETGILVAAKPYFGRNLMADIICPVQRPQMVTVRPGVMERQDRDSGRRGELIHIDAELREEDTRIAVLETIPSSSEGIPLEEADKVVAAGMGVGGREGFELVRELADILGARLGTTSLPVDKGWISEDYKIGQTGKTIRPKLYVGCGVSGAIQHSAGMINSGLIVAINTDPKAEIFQFADYGIIGDITEIVPALIRQLKIDRETVGPEAAR